ncbi:MAG: hypothetical protein WBW33_33640 [Bryobacteraceae bacterium]
MPSSGCGAGCEAAAGCSTRRNDDVLTDYSKDGVDLTLIRWMLALTPIERLQFLEERINEILAIRELNAGNQTSFNATKPL